MEHIHQFKVLEKYIEGADVVDVKVFRGQASLRAFIASMLSYYPWWVVGLYRIRKLLVGVLGLARQATPEKLPDLSPADVSFAPGNHVTFFVVRCAEEERFWVAETPEDKHLRAYFGVVKEPVNGAVSRYYVITTVFYKHWTGPVYFNLIRPFHHLVVARMARYGLARKQPG